MAQQLIHMTWTIIAILHTQEENTHSQKTWSFPGIFQSTKFPQLNSVALVAVCVELFEQVLDVK